MAVVSSKNWKVKPSQIAEILRVLSREEYFNVGFFYFYLLLPELYSESEPNYSYFLSVKVTNYSVLWNC